MTAPSEAFTRGSRLTAGAEFARVFAGADRSTDRFFTVLARLNELARARLGLAIARKAAPLAVDRNRLRRLARESFRHLSLASLDYVVMARRDAVTASKPDLRASLDRHFLRLSRRVTAS